MVVDYLGAKGEPRLIPLGASPTFAADITEIAAYFNKGRLYRRFTTQVGLLAATGMEDNDLATVDAIDGGTFKYDSSGPGWRMYGIARFATSSARASAITTPHDNMLTICEDRDYIEQYLSGWTRLVPVTGLERIIPSSAAGTGVTLDSTTGIFVCTATSALAVNGCFATDGSGMDEYEIVFRKRASSTANNLLYRNRAAGVDDATNYDNVVVSGSGTTVTAATGVAGTSYNPNGGAAAIEYLELKIADAALAFPTGLRSIDLITSNPGVSGTTIIQTKAALHRTASAFDGFSLTANTGTFTGVGWVRRRR